MLALHGEAATIAVVGAGVAGAFASDHLRTLQGPGLHLDVFEANSLVGGRAMSFELHGQVNGLGRMDRDALHAPIKHTSVACGEVTE